MALTRPRAGAGIKAAKYRLAQTDEALAHLPHVRLDQDALPGMKVDEAAKFFQDNCYYESKPAHSEAVRGTFDPEYLYYTVGSWRFSSCATITKSRRAVTSRCKNFMMKCSATARPPSACSGKSC